MLDTGRKGEISFCSPACPAYRRSGGCLYLQGLKFVFSNDRLKGTQVGEGKSIEELIMENYEKLKSYCQRLARDFHLGEDICQEVLRKALENKDSFKPDQPILPWLLKAAKNLFIDIYRKEKQKRIDEFGEADAAVYDQSFEKSESLEIISVFAFSSLTDKQRKAIELVYYDGMDIEEAAKAMGLSYKGFYSLLKRAESKLRDEVRKFL